MNSIMLITNTNFNTKAGNITLILRRAEAIYEEFGYITKINIYKGVHQERTESNDDYYSIEYIDDSQVLFNSIEKCKPKIIILYGYSSGLLAKRIKKYLCKKSIQCEVLFDVQGAIEEKWEYATSIKARLKYIPQYLAFKKAANDVDSFFVVSDELKENCQKKLCHKSQKKFYKIRCGINSVPTIENINVNRIEILNRFNIPNNAIVFAYSGYRSAWQKVDEIIKEFTLYDKHIPNAFFCFFCNSDELFIENLEKLFPNKNFLVRLLDSKEYSTTLQACDIGYILRDYKETNRVAFPNKFSDYLSSGMLIGLNASLPEPLRILKDYGLPYIDTDVNFEKKLEIINAFEKNREEYLITSRKACAEELLYQEQVRKVLTSVLKNS